MVRIAKGTIDRIDNVDILDVSAPGRGHESTIDHNAWYTHSSCNLDDAALYTDDQLVSRDFLNELLECITLRDWLISIYRRQFLKMWPNTHAVPVGLCYYLNAYIISFDAGRFNVYLRL